MSTQQTQNICITFIQCWNNIELEDVGPMFQATNVIQMLCVCWAELSVVCDIVLPILSEFHFRCLFIISPR